MSVQCIYTGENLKFLGESQIKRHAGITEENGVIKIKSTNPHVITMRQIEDKFGNGSQLTRERLIDIMFGLNCSAALQETSRNVQFQTEIFESMHVYHAVVHNQSYISLGKLMNLQAFLLCKQMKAFDKEIQCSDSKARAIVGNVLGGFCLKQVSVPLEFGFRDLKSFHLDGIYNLSGFHQVMDEFSKCSRYFSIQTDCSNVKNKKFIPILICYAGFDDAGIGGNFFSIKLTVIYQQTILLNNIIS